MPPAPLTDSQRAASQQQTAAHHRLTVASAPTSSSVSLPPAAASTASPSAFFMPFNSEASGTESPPRRRQLHELMAASASPQPPLPQPPQPLSSSTALPPEQQEAQRRVTASSIFSTSTTSFLQSRPAPATLSLSISASAAPSPAASPLPLFDASPSASSLPRQFKTPPRCTPAMIKRGLAASFATILSSPTQYNPAASGAAAAAGAAASASPVAPTPVMAAAFAAPMAQAPFGSLLIPPALAFSSAASPSASASASPAASRFHPSYATFAASTAAVSPASRSSSLSSSGESALSSSSDSLTPLSTSRSCIASQRCAALALPPLRAFMMAATEALADSDSIASCLSSLLRLLLQHARADDARLCSLQDNRHWNVDAHSTAEPPTPPAATARAGPIPVHDPDCLLYDAAAEPEMPVSVLRCAASTASILQLSPSAVSDCEFRSDPYFLPMAARLPSVLALPVLCCGKVEAVLLLTSATRHDGFVSELDVPLLQLVCELCLGLVRRRQELRREAELSAMARSLREMKEENNRLQQQLQTALAATSTK